MIVKEIEGNLITDFLKYGVKLDAMAHGSNCFNAMGAGIAKEVKERIPQAFSADTEAAQWGTNKLGSFSCAYVRVGMPFVMEEFRLVFNLYTQYYPGPNAEYSAVYNAFKAMNDKLASRPTRQRVGIPLIGCGIGGLSWDAVKAIINHTTPDIDIIVYHFKP